MDRRDKVYFSIGCVLIISLLVIIAIYSALAALVFVMLLIFALGMLKQKNPALFSRFFRSKAKNDSPHIPDSPNKLKNSRSYIPNLYLVTKSSAQATRIAVDSEEFTIGRDESCDFSVDDGSVSRVHAIIRYDPITKRSFVSDKSSYGTYLNNKRLKRDEPTPIKRGDILQISSEHRFTIEQAHY